MTLSVQIHQLDSIIEYGKQMVLNNMDRNCQHLLGYDILVDKHGNAHCLEVNAQPSLNLSHTFKLDKEQTKMVEDMDLPDKTFNLKREELSIPSAIDY